ncbi:phage tail protein [Halomonas sp. ISL-60]|uniref:phage tail protein n=1 Tax=Halomonas sp. ISL-56 TaxID=2819149 RepID=UPI001BE5E728|nr:phage tail protein [Halomonas sp. ISL-56]MBT2771309.1 phage tail protein [Halomonas sp. ISL-60]MBT2800666.1 phage tail protein [Halomonas sp. ISL-56]
MYETFPILSRADVDVGAQLQFNFNTNIVNFGDGYEQRSENGINSVRETIDVTLSLLTDADMLLVLNFIKEHSNAKPFYFTFYINETKLYTCESFSKTVVEKGRNTIAMQLRECFA